jgi:hypothetical protein
VEAGPQGADGDLHPGPSGSGGSVVVTRLGTPCSPSTSAIRRAGPSASTVTTTRVPSRSRPCSRCERVTTSPRKESHACPVRRLPVGRAERGEAPHPLRAAGQQLRRGGEPVGAQVRLRVARSTSPCPSDPAPGRGAPAAPKAAAVRQAVSARTSASSASLPARSSSSIGSSNASPAPAGRKSTSRDGCARRRIASDSTPSKVCPSANRSSCSVSSGQRRIAARARSVSSVSSTSSRAGSTTTRSTAPVERWSPTAKVRSDSTSSPQNSTRTAWSPAVGNRSTMPPRTANSPRASTWGVRA